MSIQVKSINKSYGDIQVLHDISFNCESGETLVLLGPSGAGKSSLLRVLNLLEIADNGELDIANEQFDFQRLQNSVKKYADGTPTEPSVSPGG